MKLSVLKAISELFSTYKSIFSLRRLEDNLFLLILDFNEFYLDMTKGNSRIFISKERILGSPYRAPFDVALNRYCSRAKLLSCALNGNNRILIFELLHQSQYKEQKFSLHFEFTGKHTNVILVDTQGVVIEALRHVGEGKSIRVVKPQKPFTPLPQPTCSKQIEKIANIKELLEQEYDLLHTHKLEQKRAVVLRSLEKKLSLLQERLHSLPKLEELKTEGENYSQYANLILRYLHTLKYFHSPLFLQDDNQREVKIEFPHKIRSFSQGANYFFAQNKKIKKKIANLHLQSENLQSKIDFIHSQISFVRQTEYLEDLQIFSQKLQKNKEIKKDYESFFIDGFKVSIGRNAKENVKLLQDAKADDLWLHLQNIPSSHMIIHCGKRQPREEMIYKSAKILAGLNGISNQRVLVDYTQRRFVKIIQDAIVNYAKQKTLRL
ncbi:NFACT family protein [Helicobacter cholecystus]|uniref:NFACT family protein n=1 Tax=Helicobacter cholecystus TaxID=45498 RepID=UPI002738FB70|nr:NFACT family protein [Helicobacter cholecystus]